MKRIFVVAVLLTALSPIPALGREPTPQERARIEVALRADGFIAWESIELEDTDFAGADEQQTNVEIG